MQTRAVTVAGATQTDLPGQRIKHSTNVRAIQPVAGAGDEQMRGNWSLSPVAVASTDVLGEDLAGRVMQRHQPSLAELGAADGQERCFEIDILNLKVAGFANAQPRDTQESE